jgi:hypothetical protein
MRRYGIEYCNKTRTRRIKNEENVGERKDIYTN